jgi:hypothetical protein
MLGPTIRANVKFPALFLHQWWDGKTNKERSKEMRGRRGTEERREEKQEETFGVTKNHYNKGTQIPTLSGAGSLTNPTHLCYIRRGEERRSGRN